jgi:hypothetical protein
LNEADALTKEEFKREVKEYLTGKGSEPWELIYSKVYQGQVAASEQALETAGLMLGSDKSRGYMLEMLSTHFLAGANIETQESNALTPPFDPLLGLT